jgi:sugar/nucleoside kinase (ribokinase family)
MPDRDDRRGVLAGGNFLVDHVKVIDDWPEQDTLASILSQSASNGGGPYNVLKDLAVLDPGIPLSAMCLLGDDAGGRWILDDCAEAGIDTSGVTVTSAAPTSYTDAMTVRDTGRRTFFHQRGANALLDVQHFDFTRTSARIFHLGYLMLMDKLDVVQPDRSTGAARLLASARQHGLIATVDCVSVAHPDVRTIALAALREADVLFVNEFEAGQILGSGIRPDCEALRAAAIELARIGAGARVVLHSPEGAASASTDGETTVQGSVNMPPGCIAGATGAGDAFAAGYLLGLHEGLPEPERLHLAACTAAISLTDPAPSAGMQAAGACLTLADQYGLRSP